MFQSFALLSLAAQLAAGQSASETVYGSVVVSRHGDRTWKGAPPTKLTIVGQNQMYNSGAYWRSRYLASDSSYRISGISENTYSAGQISASAPNQPLLVTSGQAFLQGLYPPTSASETLANDTTFKPPLSGFQYAPLSTIPEDSPETIWLKGDDSCPACTKASERWTSSAAFRALQESTRPFYRSFYGSVFDGVLPESDMSYSSAYNIFDYVNVGVIHNKTIAEAVSAPDLFQLRVLADSAEWARNGNATSATDAIATSGRTLSGKVLQQMTTIISSQGVKNKFSLLIISYDTFLAFFGLCDLPRVDPSFYGLPDYASTMTFELFASTTSDFPTEKDLRVRFLFRNGTDNAGPARQFPLFGGRLDLSWAEFNTGMSKIALDTVEDWCTSCGSMEPFCAQYGEEKLSSSSSSSGSKGSNALSPAVAGVIGALVTLGASAIALAAALASGLRFYRRKNKAASIETAASEKQLEAADSVH